MEFDGDAQSKCSAHDGATTMYIPDTHGEGKFECLHQDGTTIKGGHYAGGALWGDVEYKQISATTCPGMCVDYNYNDMNVYMHDCHGEPNQQWSLDLNSGALKTKYDDKCLDYNYNDQNVYMHDCHHEP